MVALADKAVPFGREGHVFGSPHRRSTFPLGASLLVVAPFLENDAYCYFIHKKKKQKDKRSNYRIEVKRFNLPKCLFYS